jgi:hypothetical protein
MNPKLQKLRALREKYVNRIATLQDSIVGLDKRIAELERLELQNMLRGANMTYQDLTDFIQAKAGQGALPDQAQEGTADEDE